jgi:hypothetical protein
LGKKTTQRQATPLRDFKAGKPPLRTVGSQALQVLLCPHLLEDKHGTKALKSTQKIP